MERPCFNQRCFNKQGFALCSNPAKSFDQLQSFGSRFLERYLATNEGMISETFSQNACCNTLTEMYLYKML